MKKIVLILIVLSLAISNFVFVSSEGMSTYENLCALEDEFIIRLREVGATDAQLQAFLDDVDSVVDSFQSNIYIDDIDEYFITIFLQNMQKEAHIPVLIAFDMAYQEEIAYMLVNRKVPQSMSTFKMIVFSDKLQFESPKDDDESYIENIVEPEPEEPVVNPPKVEIKLPFDDISEHIWAVDSIVYLYNNDVIKGTGERTFEPDKPVTREEFLKMIVKALLKTSETYSKEFGKSGQGKWYHPYLAAAEFYALIQGIYDDGFEDDVYITRQDMTAIAYRASLRADIALPNKKYSTDFLDMNTCTYYSIQAIKEMQEADIIHGTGNNMFEPYSTTTRAEAAKIVHSLMILK